MDLSLNMMPLNETPACMELGGLRGKIGFQAFSSATVCRLIRRHARELGIPKGCELPKALSEKLDAPKEEERAAAQRLADELGRRLALVFYNAKEVYPNSGGLTEQERESAETFRRCRRLILGGGLAAGLLGERITACANQSLQEVGAELQLVRYSHPQYMPLIGCAMCCPEGRSLVFDCGQTYLKSAVAQLGAGRSCVLRVAQKRPSRYVRRDYVLPASRRREAAKLDRYLEDHIVWSIQRAEGLGLSDTVVLSLAGKFEGDTLLPYGAYGKLEAVFPQYLQKLQADIARRTGRGCRLFAISDERAASLAVPEAGALVVTLGTAFGLHETAGQDRAPFTSIQIEKME